MDTLIETKYEIQDINDFSDYQRIYNDWEKINRNIKTILDCTEESIFFIDSKLNIQFEHSKCLEKVFGQKQLNGKNLIDLLHNRIPNRTVEDTKEYLDLMFKDELDAEIINELNPLVEIEMHFDDQSGIWTSSKHLSFKFKRVFEKGKISKLFSTIKDISEQKTISMKLKEVQENTEKQLEWLANIMHVEPPLLKEFLEVTEIELNQIDAELKNSRTIKNFKSFSNKIRRALNQMQNNASLLNLNFFINQIKEFESEVKQIEIKRDINGTDFIPAVFKLSKLKLMIDDVKILMQRFKLFNKVNQEPEKIDSNLLIKSIKKMVTDLSKSLGRIINLEHDNFDNSLIPVSHQKIVREFLIILLRFSIYYGIEKPEERKETNKNPEGTINIETFLDKNIFGFKLKHDGRLVKIERLLQKTVESADAIIMDEDKTPEKEQLGSEVVRFLFMPSMATYNISEAEYSKEIFKDMELVKKKLKMHGGKIKITFSSEQHCEYSISFFKN